MAHARIDIEAGWSKVHGVPVSQFRDAVTFLDPKRFHNRAFKEGRWDGRVRLNNGPFVPAGLADRVEDHLREQGVSVERRDENEKWHVDSSGFTRDILPGITLYDHQYRIARAFLDSLRGVADSPTASGKTEIYIALAKYYWEKYSMRTLMVVPRKGLVSQTANRARQYFGDSMTVGEFGDGKKSFGHFTVATDKSLAPYQEREIQGETVPADERIRAFLDTVDVLMLDEVHHASSATWYDIALFCAAVRRFGLSGTPFKDEELLDAKMIGATGPLLESVPPQELMDLGLISSPRIVMVASANACESRSEIHAHVQSQREQMTEAKRRKKPRDPEYGEVYDAAIVHSHKHNQAVVRSAEWMVDRGRRVLILCRKRAHFSYLSTLLDETGIDYEAIYGSTPLKQREAAKERMKNGSLPILLATEVMGEGEDLKGVTGIVLAEGIKQAGPTLQRIGRGMRSTGSSADDDEVWVVDIVPMGWSTLREHAIARCDAYEEKGFDVKLVEDWPHPEEDVDESGEPLLPFMQWAEFD